MIYRKSKEKKTYFFFKNRKHSLVTLGLETFDSMAHIINGCPNNDAQVVKLINMFRLDILYIIAVSNFNSFFKEDFIFFRRAQHVL